MPNGDYKNNSPHGLDTEAICLKGSQRTEIVYKGYTSSQDSNACVHMICTDMYVAIIL